MSVGENLCELIVYKALSKLSRQSLSWSSLRLSVQCVLLQQDLLFKHLSTVMRSSALIPWVWRKENGLLRALGSCGEVFLVYWQTVRLCAV